ncbi:Alpha/Beta hydrolase protein [Mycena belliarum]|uniref:Alpha/Beta hydrolase protein n=1 Tax=Mycena belliarum TaxID=1033014 RepID=A0AAD6U9M2_9AGAR|nr:Alpha/Beta hydrolase protein [Mycena belliae]
MSCPDCFRGAVLEGEPTGVIAQSLDGAYFASGGASNKRAIIFLTDIFGLPLKNSKILADSFAKHLGCDVWIPDLFAGALPSLIRNRPPVAAARTSSFVKKLQAEKKYERLGAIGYCFGGGVAIHLGATTDLFNSIVLAHPSPPSDAQLKAIKAPTAWACAEDDMAIKQPRLNEIEAFYESRKGKDDFVEYDIKVYKAHGFAARPNFAHPDVKEGFEKAFQQAVNWFNKTIPA